MSPSPSAWRARLSAPGTRLPRPTPAGRGGNWQLILPDNGRTFAPAWDAYPDSLLRQIEAWFERLTDRRLFNGRPGKPVRLTTITNYRRQLRSYLGALVLEGVDPKDLVDLAAVVTPERAMIALNHFWTKAGSSPRPISISRPAWC